MRWLRLRLDATEKGLEDGPGRAAEAGLQTHPREQGHPYLTPRLHGGNVPHPTPSKILENSEAVAKSRTVSRSQVGGSGRSLNAEKERQERVVSLSGQGDTVVRKSK